MTLAQLLIGHCNVTHEEVILAISDPINHIDVYCPYAELNAGGDGICCTRQNLAECPVFPNMIEHYLSRQQQYNSSKGKNGNGKRPQHAPNLVGPRNQQAYLSARTSKQSPISQ